LVPERRRSEPTETTETTEPTETNEPTESAELAGLAATRFGPVEWLAEVGSTNLLLLDEARRGTPAGRVVVADVQAAGRGRLGRTWEAPPGASLLVSVLLRPALDAGDRPLVLTAAALAAAEAVGRLSGLDVRIKWPNDLVVADRKLAGLLAEAADDAVVVGLGCNVSWTDLPPHLPDATSIAREAGRAPRREELLVAWLVGFERRLAQLEAGAAADLLDDVRARSATLGRVVRVERLGRGEVVGTAEDFTPAGHLVVATGAGPVEIAAGDVTHLRPA
jgi:BirA family biotin operon repressor/biotin-[acetyl-CoA-carboxylase] ligase